MKLYKGRPLDISERLEKEIRTYDYLDSLNIEYFRVDHDKVNCMEEIAHIDSALNTLVCKNLFLCNRNETNFFLLMMPGYKKFKTSIVSKKLKSSRLSFGNSEKMIEFLDVKPGSVSIMGLMNDKYNNIQLVIDKEVLEGEYIGCHPCINTTSLKIKTSDILEKYLPSVKHEAIIIDLDEIE